MNYHAFCVHIVAKPLFAELPQSGIVDKFYVPGFWCLFNGIESLSHISRNQTRIK